MAGLDPAISLRLRGITGSSPVMTTFDDRISADSALALPSRNIAGAAIFCSHANEQNPALDTFGMREVRQKKPLAMGLSEGFTRPG